MSSWLEGETGMASWLEGETLVENTPVPRTLETPLEDPQEENLPVEEPLVKEKTTEPRKGIFEQQNGAISRSYFMYFFMFLRMGQRKI